MVNLTFPIQFKVQTVKGTTKDEVLKTIFSGCLRASTSITCGTVFVINSNNGMCVRFYRLQKFNKKSSQVQITESRGKNKGRNLSIMTVIRKPHWVATYIDVPASIIEEGVQYDSTFSLTLGV